MNSSGRQTNKAVLAVAAIELLLTFGTSAHLAHADPAPAPTNRPAPPRTAPAPAPSAPAAKPAPAATASPAPSVKPTTPSSPSDSDAAMRDALAQQLLASLAQERGATAPTAPVPAASSSPAPAPAPSAAPAPAPVIPPSQRIENRDQDLSMAELANFPGGIKLEKKGIDPSSEVVLRGMVYQVCADKFEITNTSQDSSVGTSGKAGFRIVDIGGAGMACIKSLKAQGLRCNVAGGIKCVALSEKEGSRLKMNSLGDVEIGILSRSPGEDVDSDNAKFDPAVPTAIKHVSAATIAAQNEEKKRLAREAEIERNKRIFKACRKNGDELAQAQSALEALSRLTGMTPAEFEKMSKELKKAELAILKKKISKVKLSDEDALDELREEFEQYAEENPEASENIAQMFMDLSQRIATQKGATASSYAKAKEMAQAGMDLPEVSDKMTARLGAYQNTISIAALTNTLQYGSYDPFTFMPAYQSIMKNTYNEMRSSCRSMSKAGDVSDSCSLARQNYTEAAKLPQVATQAYQQELGMQQQMNQQMYQMMQQQNQIMMQGMGGGMPILGAGIGGAGASAGLNLGVPNQQAGMMQVGGGVNGGISMNLNSGINTGVRPFGI